MKIIHVVGARPQFVKLAALSRVLRDRCQEVIIHTGQHYDISMSHSFFADLEIPLPDYNLEVGSGMQGQQTARMMEGLEVLFLKEKPDWIVVYGDTNSTLAAALVAAKLLIPSAHVEACLRSFNKSMPEEVNRIVADHTCDLLFCPTQTAMDNAGKEGLLPKSHLVGDIMVDSVEFGKAKADQTSDVQDRLKLRGREYFLLTLHRPYNVDDPKHLMHILDGLESLDKLIIFPVHPRTRKIINESLGCYWKNITLVDPQPYLDFMKLHCEAAAMITDSGGVQKEAYLLQKPCITLRTETEWVETVSSGWNMLLPPYSEEFPLAILDFKTPENHPELYGSNVAEKIAGLLIK